MFPFVLTPTPRGTVVSLSYFCPSVQNRQGRALAQHLPDLQRLTQLARLPQQLEPPFFVWGDTTTGWPGYEVYEEALLEQLGQPDWELRLRAAALALGRAHRDWGKLPLESFFPGAAAGSPEFPLQVSFALAQVSKMIDDSMAQANTMPDGSVEQACPATFPSPPTADYLRSLVRSKVLLKQPTILEGLALLCLVSLTLQSCPNWPETLRHLELLIRHSSQPLAMRPLAVALLPD